MYNHIIIVCFLAMIVAQGLKMPIYYFKTKKINFKIIFSTGAMPSSHSAVVSAATYMTGYLAGVDSVAFGICFIFASIVIHDAIKVRGESGKQASAINLLALEVKELQEFIGEQENDLEFQLKELIGHTLKEVIGGILVGICVSYMYILMI